MIRPATHADLPRIHQVRHGTAENRLSDPSRVSEEEVLWYMREAIFLVAEDQEGVVQGFTCANPHTGYIWALFVIDGQQGKGFGKALLVEAERRLAATGNAQAFLTTDSTTRAAEFYRRQGWHQVGTAFGGEAAFRKQIQTVSVTRRSAR